MLGNGRKKGLTMRPMRAILDDLLEQDIRWRLLKDGICLECPDSEIPLDLFDELRARPGELLAFVRGNPEYRFEGSSNVIEFSIYAARRDQRRADKRRFEYGCYDSDGGPAA